MLILAGITSAPITRYRLLGGLEASGTACFQAPARMSILHQHSAQVAKENALSNFGAFSQKKLTLFEKWTPNSGCCVLLHFYWILQSFRVLEVCKTRSPYPGGTES